MARKELESMKYHPLRDFKLRRSGDQASNAKRKKLKTSINCKFCETCLVFLHVGLSELYDSRHGSILLQTVKTKWDV